MILESTLTCPLCGHVKTETMPTDACQWFMSATTVADGIPRWDYDCEGCHAVLKPKPGDSCVFCSWGTVPCPPIQEHGNPARGLPSGRGHCC